MLMNIAAVMCFFIVAGVMGAMWWYDSGSSKGTPDITENNSISEKGENRHDY